MKIKFNDFRRGINSKTSDNLVGLTEAKIAYNFDHIGGSLKSELPFRAEFCDYLANSMQDEYFIGADNDVSGGSIFYFKKYDFDNNKDASKLIFVNNNFQFFYLNLDGSSEKFEPLDITFTSSPLAINYRLDSEDVIIFSSPTDNMVVWNGVSEPEIVIDAPKITSMCLHSERLFATTSGSSDEVWFSDDLDPTNWSVSLVDAGFIQLADERGDANKVVSYNGYVYIFRDQGISRLSASGAQEEFYLSHLFVSSGKIFDKTIALCGDRIIFVASDGIYAFNGTETTKILDDIDGLVKPSEESQSVFFNGKYYLTCHIDFNDEAYNDADIQNNALFVMDVTTKEYTIFRGLNVVSMTVICANGEYKLVLLNNGKKEDLENCLVVNSDESLDCSAKYITGLYDFLEPSKKKVVRKVVVKLKSGEQVIVKLFNEANEMLKVEIDKSNIAVPVVFEGYSIGFSIECGAGVELESVYLEVF
ncbi:MAG: hypothetical protein J6J23_01960 [Clostridia bacterium]|nr:hypothetical protein [Clostridia bacterium]